jgi:hypothetical protein
MYWRKGIGSALLWIAAVTAALSAVAAYVQAGSGWGALAFLVTAAILSPLGHELIAAVRHQLAPAKAAFTAFITLVPIGIGFVIVDGVAKLDREAVKLGFSSAGQWARAKDLKLATPQALADHDAAELTKALAAECRRSGASPPLECFDPEHGRTAQSFAEGWLVSDEFTAQVRAALDRQRVAFLQQDADCKDLLERIDEDAVPVILGNRPAFVRVAAAVWARNFSAAELTRLNDRSRPGITTIVNPSTSELERKLGARRPVIERELDQVLQSWARRIVLEEPGWRSLLKGRPPLTRCRPAEVAARS